DVKPLISHAFELGDAKRAYDLLSSADPSLGILLRYPGSDPAAAGQPIDATQRRVELEVTKAGETASGVVAFLGAGGYAGKVLVPAFRRAGAHLHSVVSRGGVTAAHVGKKHGFRVVSTDESGMLRQAEVDTVVVATRHDLHARQVIASLHAGKHVFCEKPLCLSLEELEDIRAAAEARPAQLLMVGFNRRFAPQVRKMQSLLAQVSEPRCFILTVNAGAIPGDHWTQDREIGGGRIVGEGCHFIDLLRHLANSPVVRHRAVAAGGRRGSAAADDCSTITLEFQDGSVGTIHYFANGNKGFPKERIEVFCGGRILQLDNFRRMRGWGWGAFRSMNLWRQDKGQLGCVQAFMDAVRSSAPAPISREEIYEVSRVTLEIGAELAESAC
ncbi:MAG: Gfo/Idh/MocA family oxidoreductase, partial [Gammaproteobacteria bacterium]|nr:Gfo/Idh/MocA family oxidoreductase [Gammaproteobacteria bacterium]